MLYLDYLDPISTSGFSIVFSVDNVYIVNIILFTAVAHIAVTIMRYLFTDVTTLLEKRTYKYGKYTFDVAEYYPDVGVCIPDSLCVFPSKIGTTNGK